MIRYPFMYSGHHLGSDCQACVSCSPALAADVCVSFGLIALRHSTGVIVHLSTGFPPLPATICCCTPRGTGPVCTQQVIQAGPVSRTCEKSGLFDVHLLSQILQLPYRFALDQGYIRSWPGTVLTRPLPPAGTYVAGAGMLMTAWIWEWP